MTKLKDHFWSAISGAALMVPATAAVAGAMAMAGAGGTLALPLAFVVVGAGITVAADRSDKFKAASAAAGSALSLVAAFGTALHLGLIDDIGNPEEATDTKISETVLDKDQCTKAGQDFSATNARKYGVKVHLDNDGQCTLIKQKESLAL